MEQGMLGGEMDLVEPLQDRNVGLPLNKNSYNMYCIWCTAYTTRCSMSPGLTHLLKHHTGIQKARGTDDEKHHEENTAW